MDLVLLLSLGTFYGFGSRSWNKGKWCPKMAGFGTIESTTIGICKAWLGGGYGCLFCFKPKGLPAFFAWFCFSFTDYWQLLYSNYSAT